MKVVICNVPPTGTNRFAGVETRPLSIVLVPGREHDGYSFSEPPPKSISSTT
jgi:hypothetical protein